MSSYRYSLIIRTYLIIIKGLKLQYEIEQYPNLQFY